MIIRNSTLIAATVLSTPCLSAGLYFQGTGPIHTKGYTGERGPVIVQVQYPDSVRIPVENALATLRAIDGSIANTVIISQSEETDLPPGNQLDLEETILHELGHLEGLGHTIEDGWANMAPGPNGVLDLGVGPDGYFGTADDDRGDDQFFGWVNIRNDPYKVIEPVGNTTYIFVGGSSIDELFPGDTAPALNNLNDTQLGRLPSSPVMGSPFFFAVQRRWALQEVTQIRFARTGLDEIYGTEDDYWLEHVRVPASEDCELDCLRIRIGDFNVGLARAIVAFGVVPGENPKGHLRLAAGSIEINEDVDWYYSGEDRSDKSTFVPTPPALFRNGFE